MSVPAVSTTDVLGYKLFINIANSNAIPSILVYDGHTVSNVLQVTVGGLSSGQIYLLAYIVINRAGPSELSPTLQFISGKLPASPLTPPFQISVSTTQVTFGWTPSSDVGGASKLDGYNIYSGQALIQTVSAQTRQFTLTSVTAGESYKISVSAVSIIGEGPLSNSLIIWAIDLPSAPSLILTDTNRDSCSVKWKEVSPGSFDLITGY